MPGGNPTFKKGVQPAHLKGAAQKTRVVVCRGTKCKKKVTVKGPRMLPLCPKHRGEHSAKVKEESAKRRRNARKDDSGGLPKKRVQHPGPPQSVESEVVPIPPDKAQAEIAQPEGPPIPPKVEKRTGDFSEAIEVITAPCKAGDGYRVGFIANTGLGKTTSIKRFLKDRPEFTLIHDDSKRDAQYPGPIVERLQDAPEDVTQVVFRGDVYRNTEVPAEYVAALGKAISIGARQPCRIVIDELDRACTPSGQALASESLKWCLKQGRQAQVSVVYSTQDPAALPREVIGLSSTICIGQLAPRAINYLDERMHFEKKMTETIAGLGVGEFVIWENGKMWNGIVYSTPAPTREEDHGNTQRPDSGTTNGISERSQPDAGGTTTVQSVVRAGGEN